MRKVCRLGREVLDIVAAEVRPGVTTDYLDEVCHKASVEREVRRIALLRYGIPMAITDYRSVIRLPSTTTTFPNLSVHRSTKLSATAFQTNEYY